MQCVDHIFGVVLDNVGVGKNRDPVVLAALGGFDAVHAETTRKTCDTTKDRFE